MMEQEEAMEQIILVEMPEGISDEVGGEEEGTKSLTRVQVLDLSEEEGEWETRI